MAAPRPALPGSPDARDARVPCPLCGGLIHPIAGRCKHCKAELASLQAARPPATTPLPALRAAAAPTTTGQVHWNPGRGDTTPPAARAITPAPHPAARDEAILPPRPTQRGHAVEPEARGGWRSWPVIVIALAMVAIVVAVVLMVWPAGGHRDDAGKRSTGAPPAPARMDTAPEVTAPAPHAQVTPPDRDPWAGRNDVPGAASGAAPGAAPGKPINPADNVDPSDGAADPDDGDPFADPVPAGPTASMELVMARHICEKARQCAGGGDLAPTIVAVCASLRALPAKPPANCPAATRCLRLIDRLDCTGAALDPNRAGDLLQQLADCNAATQCGSGASMHG